MLRWTTPALWAAKRGSLTILCLLPLVAVILSFAVDFRVVGGGLRICAAIAFALGSVIAYANFKSCWLRFYLNRRRGGRDSELPSISPIPLLGDLVAVSIWFMPCSAVISVGALGIMGLNLGGAAWIIPAIWSAPPFENDARGRLSAKTEGR